MAVRGGNKPSQPEKEWLHGKTARAVPNTHLFLSLIRNRVIGRSEKENGRLLACTVKKADQMI